MSSSSLEKNFRYLFWLHLALLIVSIVITQVIYAVLALLAAIIVHQRGYKWSAVDALFLSFAGVRIISILVSEFPEDSMRAIVREAVFYPYYFVVSVYCQVSGVYGIKRASRVMLVSGAVVSLIAIAYVLLGIKERGGLATGYSTLATYLSFVIAISAAFVANENDRRKFFAGVALLIVVFLGLMSTFSRAQWLSAFFIIGIAGAVKSRKVFLQISMGVILIILLVAPLRERLLSLADPVKNDSGRIALWSLALSHIPDHPYFGYGPETFLSIVTDRSSLDDKNVSSWHNEYVQIAVESGIIGLAALCAFHLYGLKIVFTYLQRKIYRTVHYREYMLMTLYLFIVLFFESLFGSVTTSIFGGFLFKFGFVGIVFAYHTIVTGDRED